MYLIFVESAEKAINENENTLAVTLLLLNAVGSSNNFAAMEPPLPLKSVVLFISFGTMVCSS